MKTILIADDHPIIRNGVIQIINDLKKWHFTFLEANNFKETEWIVSQNPHIDLVILDIKMPGMNAINAISSLRNINPGIKILIFSSYDEQIHALRYIAAGANGYLQKDCEEKEIREAVLAIIHSGAYTNERLQAVSTQDRQADKRGIAYPFCRLSNREMEVAQLMINGLGNLEIANELNLGESTVSTYKNRIFEKLGINNITDLFRLFQDYST